MNEQQSPGLDFSGDDALSGFRLKRLEVFNWGTFNDQVWTLNPDGRNTLLTGDIGSGKSTLVDAVTTLLVPANKVDYNKAAGAEKKERHLRSYVLGYYKSERHDGGGKARPVGLRGQNSYSVILGVFHNEGYDETVTLAQVFWMKELQGQPERFFVGAKRELSIQEDFAGFGSDISTLKKQLSKAGHKVTDRFKDYGAWFRRRFGIEHEQALELFHQTVSMKSVGNLTAFVRDHMLEPFDIAPRIQALLEHFENLTRAHDAVLKARRQIQMLTPMVEDCDQYHQIFTAVASWRDCRDALSSYFAEQKLQLLDQRFERLTNDLVRQQAKVEQLSTDHQHYRDQQTDLKQQISEQGGDRIERLKQETRRLSDLRMDRERKAERYAQLLAPLAMTPADTEAGFLAQQTEVLNRRNELEAEQADAVNRLNELEFDFRTQKGEYETLRQTIEDLKSRKSNIEQAQVDIRSSLCEALSLDESELPFAGELLQVRDEDKPWEGAIQRLMRSFGLSLLVPDEHYSSVARWVDDTRLRGRFVYFRMRSGSHLNLPTLHPDSLAHKLAIKPDAVGYEWMEQELARRFDIACCESQDAFRREKRAITLNGQVKGGERHEKDDRFALNDRRRFVLGWSNEDKIQALEQTAQEAEQRLADIGARIADVTAQKRAIADQLTLIIKLEELEQFQDMDWQPLARQVADLQAELQALEASSDLLKTLTERLRALEAETVTVSKALDQAKDDRAKTEQKAEDAKALKVLTEEGIDQVKLDANRTLYETLDGLKMKALGEHTLTVESCDNRQQDMRRWLQEAIDAEDRKLNRLRERIVKAMTDYKHQYPLDTQEADASVTAADEFRSMLGELLADDLPRFEQRFKSLLNENTIREIANFQSQLHRERQTIRERIEQINGSLTRIDYNPGRFIRLEAEPSQDADIREFQNELRACTEGTLGGTSAGSEDEQYSESKFLQVSHIIERFKGREGLAELDRRWTTNVTDVRNWFGFAASERWREDDAEHEHYSDSGGKSGGQKEKLAYTVLAASLAYQFGLEWGAIRSRSFRFVVIDEAFGRGSDESASYGLSLFNQLNLQLLIVTPLQKLHIIEPHVSSVGFVHNPDGMSSKIRNLSIEAYQQEKAEQALRQTTSAPSPV